MSNKDLDFIRRELFSSLKDIKPGTKANWGKMGPQHMVEHLADFFDISSGKLKFDLITPAEQLPAYRNFLFSDKEFRENTKAPLTILGDEPLSLRKQNIEEAIIDLEESVSDFFKYHENEAAVPTVHPVFGALNPDEWIRLHFKHVSHHLRQFGLKSYT
ncbi:MAG: DUF1569 domain-containing protein [Ferruginibacter sp.]|nr:DUF1569 domain-containing protein [Ferruginibacter sp.]